MTVQNDNERKVYCLACGSFKMGKIKDNKWGCLDCKATLEIREV